MRMVTGLVFFFLILLVGGSIIAWILKKNVSGIKTMLLGINITLIGGILSLDPNTSLGGVEYIIALLGLIFCIVGLNKKD